jgi:methylenetetrahydrofolate reductase (NADPH)
MKRPLKTRISIELVARDAAYLDADLHQLSRLYEGFDTVNIPDLLRFPVRSWQGCVQARHYVNSTIPHLRAIDYDLSKPWALIDYVRRHRLDELLVVKGDPPVDGGSKCFDTSSVEFIACIKRELPQVKVYAAIDPYRASLDVEVAYAKEKLAAGADGFFTQPFFELGLMDQYAKALRQLSGAAEIFWGVSPVLGQASQNYWQRVNKVSFPEGFMADLGWNQRFACEALKWVKARNESIYFMPIRVDLKSYFTGVLF